MCNRSRPIGTCSELSLHDSRVLDEHEHEDKHQDVEARASVDAGEAVEERASVDAGEDVEDGQGLQVTYRNKPILIRIGVREANAIPSA